MAGDAKKLQPIIIKRVKKGGHAAHGGAWKIAYADFVTAMMAFFLLMWLLGSTSEGDRKGISDYFQSPMKVALQGGPGAGASNSVLTGGGKDLTQQVGQTRKGDGQDASAKKMSRAELKAEVAKRDAKTLAALSAKIAQAIASNPKLSEFSSQIKLEVTPDGLQIQIIDDQKRPMFDSGSAAVKPYMRDILREIGIVLTDVENKVSMDGHTDRTPYGNAARGYSNWELSADRANAARRELVLAGMPEEKLVRVVGMASSLLLEPDNPFSPSNRRISILVMTKDAEERMLGADRVPLEPETEGPPATGEPPAKSPP
ncbi:flagellar motor protein MotB [Rhodoferax saidenbachensis]|uniref:Flagellar motor protein MotB n=1 Tax=Rhodoferax saidenbachensis TaxID=1484693 RepID=A0A1P8K6F6_9BURK|nr:flagellar motor protein MotB [Rhodoferax saidenbachensis]APW41584.1 flagellar motor protein MotB [Rhodoferax saidenbachensis]